MGMTALVMVAVVVLLALLPGTAPAMGTLAAVLFGLGVLALATGQDAVAFLAAGALALVVRGLRLRVARRLW